MTAVVAIVVVAAVVAALCLVWMVLAVEQALSPSPRLEPTSRTGPAGLLFDQVLDPAPPSPLQRPPRMQMLQVYEHDELSGPSIITTEFQRT